MARLNQERQEKLEPLRFEKAKEEIKKLGFEINYEDGKSLNFYHKDELVFYYPYSGWHSGKSIKDGRGLENLLKQIKQTP